MAQQSKLHRRRNGRYYIEESSPESNGVSARQIKAEAQRVFAIAVEGYNTPALTRRIACA